jgi:DNA-binding PadR family transcriptional regulator
MTTEERANQLKRHRGVILQFLDSNHFQQLSRMDDVEMWGLMMDMGYRVGQEYVITLLQDLSDRGYVTLRPEMNRLNGRTHLKQIQITPKGRDLVNRTGGEDPAVLIP